MFDEKYKIYHKATLLYIRLSKIFQKNSYKLNFDNKEHIRQILLRIFPKLNTLSTIEDLENIFEILTLLKKELYKIK